MTAEQKLQIISLLENIVDKATFLIENVYRLEMSDSNAEDMIEELESTGRKLQANIENELK